MLWHLTSSRIVSKKLKILCHVDSCHAISPTLSLLHLPCWCSIKVTVLVVWWESDARKCPGTTKVPGQGGQETRTWNQVPEIWWDGVPMLMALVPILFYRSLHLNPYMKTDVRNTIHKILELPVSSLSLLLGLPSAVVKTLWHSCEQNNKTAFQVQLMVDTSPACVSDTWCHWVTDRVWLCLCPAIDWHPSQGISLLCALFWSETGFNLFTLLQPWSGKWKMDGWIPLMM